MCGELFAAGFPGGKNLPAMQEVHVRSLGQEVPLERGMATHSSILAWKIPWTEKPDRLQNMGSQTQLSTHQPFMTAPISGACFIL